MWQLFRDASRRVRTLIGLGAVACAAPPAERVATPSSTARPAFEVISASELVTPPSSEYAEVRLAMSPDGGAMLWGSTDRPGGPGSYDIWMSRRAAGGWTAPVPVSFDTDAKDYDPAYSPDGRYVYFFSNRPGGLGGDDLYRVPVVGDGFGAVEHLDASVNSAGNEWAPVAMRDGSLLFASDGRGGSGRQDLFVAAPHGGGFAPAQPLPGAINTAADEFDAAELASGDLVFSRSANLDREPVQLIYAHRGSSGFDRGVQLPATINVDGDYTYAPSIDWRDPSSLYFTGSRPEASLGKRDIYRVRFRVRWPPSSGSGSPIPPAAPRRRVPARSSRASRR